MARQVLPIVGAIVGAYFGNPQLGYAIGSIIGNAVDPQVLQGPRLQELPVMGTTEGGYRQVVYGTCVVRQCQLIDWGPLEDVTVSEQQGKGGGPVIESQRLYQTYAVAIGEPVKAIRYIKRDGVMVYDVRPGSSILTESAEFAKRMRFYDGGEAQLPDPDLEAMPHNGVGNTPAYRGTSYFVIIRDDLTDRRGSIPTYEVEVVQEGVQPDFTGGWFLGPVAEDDTPGGSQAFYKRAATPAELPLAAAVPIPSGIGALIRISAVNGSVFFHGNAGSAVSHDGGGTWSLCDETLSIQYDVFFSGLFYYCGTLRSPDGVAWVTTPNLPAGTFMVSARTYQQTIVAVWDNSGFGVSVSYDQGGNWETYGPAHFGNWTVSDVKPGHLQWKYTLASTYGYWTDDDFETMYPEGTFLAGYRPYYSNDIDDVWLRKSFGGPSGGMAIRTSDGGASWEVALTYPFDYGDDNDQTIGWGDNVWAAVRLGAGGNTAFVNYSIASGVEDSWTEVDDPVYGLANNIVYTGVPALSTVPPGYTTLEALVADLCDRCGIPAANLELGALTDLLRGVTLGGPYNGAGAITSLMPGFPFDVCQPEEKVVAVKRGGPVQWVITEADLLETPDEAALRGQEIEYPRQLQLKYLDCDQNYAAPAAVVSRTSPDVRVNGEATIELPISMNRTEAVRACDRALKVMWEDLNGELTVAVPSGRFRGMTAADIVAVQLRGAVYRLRAEKISDADGQLDLKARRDRQSAYTSNLTPIPLPPPTPPPPSLSGVTVFAALNIPGIVDEDDALGFRIGISGLPGTAWHGANVAYSLDAGANWTSLGNFTRRTVMGTLLDPLAEASEFYTDATNRLRVQLVGDDELEGLTTQQFLSEGNPAAIVFPDGTAELVQFRDVEDLGSRQWRLTTLLRGRLATTPGPHLAGARFVMLAGTTFVPLPSSLIGQTMLLRVTSLNTSPEDAPVFTFAWNPPHSQREFPADFLSLARGPGVITATWSPRHRFGTDVIPVPSVRFGGWRVTFTDGTTTQVVDTPFSELSHPDTAFSGPVTVTVQQLNTITGPGPGITETI